MTYFRLALNAAFIVNLESVRVGPIKSVKFPPCMVWNFFVHSSEKLMNSSYVKTYIWIDVVTYSSDGHDSPPKAFGKVPGTICWHHDGPEDTNITV